MKQSLVSILSILAFSFGLVKAVPTIPGQGHGLQIGNSGGFDAMGVYTNHIICNKDVFNKDVFNKRDTYAAVGLATRYTKENKQGIVGCETIKFCTKYPKQFLDETIRFKVPGPYEAFPILPDGKLFTGKSLTVSNLVVYNYQGDVAGIVGVTFKGYVKCLLDSNYMPPPKGLRENVRNTLQYYKENWRQ